MSMLSIRNKVQAGFLAALLATASGIAIADTTTMVVEENTKPAETVVKGDQVTTTEQATINTTVTTTPDAK